MQHKKAAWMWCNTGKAQHEKNPIWREFTQKSGKHQNSEKSETQRKHEKRKKQHTLKECDTEKVQPEKKIGQCKIWKNVWKKSAL